MGCCVLFVLLFGGTYGAMEFVSFFVFRGDLGRGLWILFVCLEKHSPS